MSSNNPSYNVYLRPGGQQNYGVQYLFDPALVVYDLYTNIPQTTGGFRPIATTDMGATNLNVSGLNLTVGAVTLTGTNPVQVSNFPSTFNVQVTGSPTVTVGGVANVSVTNASLSVIASVNNSVLATSGVATLATGSYTTTFTTVTGSQTVIAPGYRSWSASVLSGSAYVCGAGPFPAGASLGGGGYPQLYGSTPIVIGGTGTAASPTFILINYES